MHLPSLSLGALLGALAVAGVVVVETRVVDPARLVPVVETAGLELRAPSSQLSSNQQALEGEAPSKPNSTRTALFDERAAGAAGEVGRASAPSSEQSLTWSPLERYGELCSNPRPETGPWVEVARGLAQIDALDECTDSWWQAYRRDPALAAPRAFLSERHETWRALIFDELRRFDCGFSGRRAMEADLLALLASEGRLAEACDALRVAEFVARLRRRDRLQVHDLMREAQWRALAVCDPTLWESLLTDALASDQFSVRREALGRLIPVWVEQGRIADLKELSEDPGIGQQHRRTFQKHWPAALTTEERLEQANYDADAALALYSELRQSEGKERADAFLRERIQPSTFDGDDLARLAAADDGALIPLLEERLEAALVAPLPDPDTDDDEVLLSIEVFGDALARLGNRELAKRSYDRLKTIDDSSWIDERLRDWELGRAPR